MARLTFGHVLTCTAIVGILSTAFALKPPPIRSVCNLNEYQMAHGVLIYLQDNAETCPGGTWMDQIKPYVKNEKYYHCSDVPAGQYGYALISNSAGKKLVNLGNPSVFPMLFDSTVMGRSALAATKMQPSPGRHSGLNNFAAFDGHVYTIKPRHQN